MGTGVDHKDKHKICWKWKLNIKQRLCKLPLNPKTNPNPNPNPNKGAVFLGGYCTDTTSKLWGVSFKYFQQIKCRVNVE